MMVRIPPLLLRRLRGAYSRVPADVRQLLRQTYAGARALGWNRTRLGRTTSARAISSTRLPVETKILTFDDVREALEGQQIDHWSLGVASEPMTKLGVSMEDWPKLERAFQALGGKGYWVADPRRRGTGRPIASSGHPIGGLASGGVLSVYRPEKRGDGAWVTFDEYGCQIELWERQRHTGSTYMVGPRENRASMMIGIDEFEPVLEQLHGRTVPVPGPVARTMVDDVDFPIDVVYTWVDGADPAWRRRRLAAQANQLGVPFHEEAVTESRFTSRDELKYSLRSLDYFAPWVRNVFLVTDRQAPPWLDRSNPRLKVVDHQDIFLDSTMLPSFNSNSIISNLHHIEGLSEHYIYFNDDVFLGRWVEPAQFFLGSGIALVSPANNRRRFGEARVEEEPHFNISRNIRSILQDAFGVTVSRAIKHTPHPQIRSLHYQMESRFREHYQSTWSHPFRHHDDIAADQLHHYYAQITGRAVPGQLKYSYINLMDETHSSRLSSILALRNRDVFCLNDAPTGGRPVPEDLVQHFLDGYFPVPSSFEVPE